MRLGLSLGLTIIRLPFGLPPVALWAATIGDDGTMRLDRTPPVAGSPWAATANDDGTITITARPE
ncbi:hypothetical protein [Profundibacterium mesophilum]|uniref:Uncharacterized protein n=1 Tax=Profundibacterium mesophilum KAUST100406-0324 TaxID=1037889 RepID=A0A921NT57_9RHOB|nr:hypothetical protein [Profundibacterium mesophilum]KAF0675055.1 hypothetical protein PMES_02576 [Profundibacterium mesophilum KAUST100406-0324]